MAKIKTLAQKLIPWRIWVQISFLAVWLDPLALRYHNVCAPVFNCYACPLATFACPIGVIHQFSALHVFPFITVGFLVLFGVLFGGFICGWACPIGLLQDLFSRLRTPKFQLPTWTGYLSYITLIALVLVIPYLYGVEHFLAICQVCPVGALESSLPRKIATPLFAGDPIDWTGGLKLKMAILAVFVAAMLFIYRPWCRLCPLGAIFKLFNRFTVFFLKFDPAACNTCRSCEKSCDLVTQPHKKHNSLNCIRCLECTECGPKALSLGSIFQNQQNTETPAKINQTSAGDTHSN